MLSLMDTILILMDKILVKIRVRILMKISLVGVRVLILINSILVKIRVRILMKISLFFNLAPFSTIATFSEQ